MSDIEPGPQAILAHHHPDVPNLGDITRIDWTKVEPVDVICGGSPCTDLSLAGARAGMTKDTRSGLWESMFHAITAIHPRLVVWENVQGALSASAFSLMEPEQGHMGGRTTGPVLRALGRVLGDLASIGYDATWTVVQASDVGAPHKRARVFIVAHPHGQPWLERWEPATRETPGGRSWSDISGRDRTPRTLIPTPTASDWKGGYHQEGKGMSLSQATKLLPTPVAQAPGNTAEAHLRKKPGRTQVTDLGIIAREGLFTTGGNLLPTPQATNATYSSNGYGPNLHETAGTLRDSFGPYAPAVAHWETITGRTAPAPTEPPLREGGKPRLSVRFVEWLMGLPDGHVTGVGLSREKTLRALGNGVVPLQAAEGILRALQQERQAALEEGWPEYAQRTGTR